MPADPSSQPHLEWENRRLRESLTKLAGGYTQEEYDARWRHEYDVMQGMVREQALKNVQMERILDGCKRCSKMAHKQNLYRVGQDIKKSPTP